MFGLESLGQGMAQLPGGPTYQARKKERREQRRYAMSGIRWKVKDAIAAGIHPLAAMGASTQSYRPQHIEPIRGFPDIGAIIDKAKANKMSNDDKALVELAKDSAVLDNDYKRIRNQQAIIDLESPDTTTKNDLLIEKPAEVVRPSPGNVGIQPGVKSLKDIYVDEFGTINFELTQEASEPRESGSGIKKIHTNIYDAIMIGKVATQPKLRQNLINTATRELKRVGRLKKGQAIYWDAKLQVFKIKSIGAHKKYIRDKKRKRKIQRDKDARFLSTPY